MPDARRTTATERVVNLGLGCNILLAVLKTVGGILGGSAGLLADGVNSTSDVVYYAVVKVFMRISAKPADPQHPYGHTQMESIAALVVGSFVVTTAVGIFWKSLYDVYVLMQTGVGETSAAGHAALGIALGTVALKIVLTRVTLRVGRHSGHSAVIALAYDHRNDVFSAAAVVCGIAGARLGLLWTDPLAGSLVAVIILHTGITILRESSAELMDTLPDRNINLRIRQAVAQVKAVRTVEEIHAHRFGPYYVINITIGIDGSLSVAEGDAIASELERHVVSMVGLVRRVYVHYHPASLEKAEGPRSGAEFAS